MKKYQNSHKSFNTGKLKQHKPKIPQKTAQISKCLNISKRIPSSAANNTSNVLSVHKVSRVSKISKVNQVSKVSKASKKVSPGHRARRTNKLDNPYDACLICNKQEDLLQMVSYNNSKDHENHFKLSKRSEDEDVKQEHVTLTSISKNSTLLSFLLRKIQGSVFAVTDVEGKKTYFKRKWIDILLTVFKIADICDNSNNSNNSKNSNPNTNSGNHSTPSSHSNLRFKSKSNIKDKIFGRGVELAKRVPIEFLATCDYADFRQTIEDYLLHRRNDLTQVTSELNDLIFLINFTDYVNIYNDLCFYRQFYRNFLAKYKISFIANPDEDKLHQHHQHQYPHYHKTDGSNFQSSEHCSSIFGIHGYSAGVQSVSYFPFADQDTVNSDSANGDICDNHGDRKCKDSCNCQITSNITAISNKTPCELKNSLTLHQPLPPTLHNECTTFTTVFSRCLPSKESNDISSIKTIAKRIAMQNKLHFVRFFTEISNGKEKLTKEKLAKEKLAKSPRETPELLKLPESPKDIHDMSHDMPMTFNRTDTDADMDRDSDLSMQDSSIPDEYDPVQDFSVQDLSVQMSTKMSHMIHQMKKEEPTMKQARLEHFKPLINSLNYIPDYNIWDIIFDYVNIYTFFHFPLGIQALCHDMLTDPDQQQTDFEKSYRSLQLSKGLFF